MSCDDGDGSRDTIIDDERLKAGESLKKVSDASKAVATISCKEFKGRRIPDSSLGSINALIESCVKLSEPNVDDSVMDDVGMNLLASVAADEMLTSEMTSPASSPQTNGSVALQSSAGNDQSKNAASDAQGESVADTALPQKIGECKTSWTPTEEMVPGEQQQGAEVLSGNVRDAEEAVEAGPVAVSPAVTVEKNVGEWCEDQKEKSLIGHLNPEDSPLKEMKAVVSLLSKSKVEDDASDMEMTTEAVEAGPASENKVLKAVSDDFEDGKKCEKPSEELHSEDVDKKLYNKNVDSLKSDAADEADVPNPDRHGLAQTNVENPSNEKEGKEEKKENIALFEPKSVGSSCKTSCDPSAEGKDDATDSGTGNLMSAIKVEKESASSTAVVVSLPSTEVSNMDAKVEFDLNEGLSTDDGRFSEPVIPTSSARSSIQSLVNPLPVPPSSVSTIPIPPAAAKGPFVPPDDFLRTKVELGWKGSAATSAFRPAEPRKVSEMQLLAAGAGQRSDATSSRQSRPLNIDLNVADEGIAEDAESRDFALETVSLYSVKASHERTHNLVNPSSRGSGGLDLDLNQMDDDTDIWNSSGNNNGRLDASLPSVKSSSAVRRNGGEAVSKRDFDLNDGPVLDELSAEPSTSSQQTRSNLLPQHPVSTLKMNNSDLGIFSSWIPPGSTFSAVTVPSILPNRGDQPLPLVSGGGQPRMMGPSSGGIPFTHDVYRGSVLSTSPAVSFPSTPFQYFPYGPSFPLQPASFSTSATTYVDPSSSGRLCFPPVHSQMLGASGAVGSQYARPYVVSLQDGSSTFDGNKKWSRPGLDLNSGPGGSEAEGKEDISALAPRNFPIASSQALAEEQARMYQVSSGVLKRKEPDGGWDSYKQSTWQ
ncbi:hypothetical protein MLD38_026136 [Melastoma candidum]|nr:hypothetical protein MLD38_026136 [Melastoma candidum]